MESNRIEFPPGNYIKGDIKPGIYAFITNGERGYYAEEDDSGSIINNHHFESFGYVKIHGVGNIKISRGHLINVDYFSQYNIPGAKSFYEVINHKENYNQSGFYKIGTDIEPGVYIFESFGSGYYAIYSGPISSGTTIRNDNFNGRVKINLEKNQYLEIHRAMIKKID